jgi:hypothetical protein
VEESEAEFFVETLDALLLSPELWMRRRPHPDTDKMDSCYHCHEMIDSPFTPLTTGHSRAIGTWKGIASCFSCHNIDEHEIRHALIAPASNQCLQCHTIH